MRRPARRANTVGPPEKLLTSLNATVKPRRQAREIGRHGSISMADLLETVTMLAEDESLPGDRGCRKIGGIAAVPCFETRLRALLSHEGCFDSIKKFLILRKLQSSCLEGRTALIRRSSISEQPRYFDHSSVEWSNHRDCHIKARPDPESING